MFAEMEILNIFSVNQNKPTIECPIYVTGLTHLMPNL